MPNMNPTPQEQQAASGHDLNPTDARQGREVHRVRYVLAISLGAGIVALAIVLAVFVV